MKKEFIPYEQALALKALGFNEKCIMHWWKGKLSYYQMGDFSPTHTSAPTFSQAFRWFREKYDYIGFIYQPNETGYWAYSLEDKAKYDTYEEAELACLEKLIEIVEPELN
jgi:hypothetical protein